MVTFLTDLAILLMLATGLEKLRLGGVVGSELSGGKVATGVLRLGGLALGK